VSTAILFWDVDTQVDFLDPEGKLYVPGAEEIVPNLWLLTRFAQQNHIPVVASTDAHTEADPEFQHYPPHCLINTPGQKKIRETRFDRQIVIPDTTVSLPANLEAYGQVILEKKQLDVFTNPNVDTVLAALGKSPRRASSGLDGGPDSSPQRANSGLDGGPDSEVVLYGVVTELCVSCAARGLLDRGYRVSVVRDAVRHLDPSKGSAALEEIERRGGKITRVREVLQKKVA